MTDLYTVFVGGMEVNDYHMTLEKAKELAEDYLDDGYDEVAIIPIIAIEELPQ